MNDFYIFIWGVIATVFAVGPLAVAGYYDLKAKRKSEKSNGTPSQPDASRG